MSYSEIVSIVNEISRWAVLVSLVYVALQTRLSVRHMRAQIQQGTAARIITILLVRPARKMENIRVCPSWNFAWGGQRGSSR